jgi:hypothetical protein
MEEKRVFSVLNLIILLLAIAVLVFLVMPGIASLFTRARSATDKENLELLNYTTTVYCISNDISRDEAFSGLNGDEARMQLLVDAGMLTSIPKPQQEGASFGWSWDSREWVLYINGAADPLTELGSALGEISSAMIKLELELKTSTGSFGRSWGDYAYTDIGLDPTEWKSAVGHIIYTPCGSSIAVCPEKGYTFLVEDLTGSVQVLPASYNWSLICDCESGMWYYHTIAEGTGIDITTLQIIPG